MVGQHKMDSMFFFVCLVVVLLFCLCVCEGGVLQVSFCFAIFVLFEFQLLGYFFYYSQIKENEKEQEDGCVGS